jgi:hypothetical protein
VAGSFFPGLWIFILSAAGRASLTVFSDSGDPQNGIPTRRSSLVRGIEAEAAVDPNLPGHSDGCNVSAPIFTASQGEKHGIELGEAIRSESNPIVGSCDAQYAGKSSSDLKIVWELMDIIRRPTVRHRVPEICFDLAQEMPDGEWEPVWPSESKTPGPHPCSRTVGVKVRVPRSLGESVNSLKETINFSKTTLLVLEMAHPGFLGFRIGALRVLATHSFW